MVGVLPIEPASTYDKNSRWALQEKSVGKLEGKTGVTKISQSKFAATKRI
jgi:hypothetical protein